MSTKQKSTMASSNTRPCRPSNVRSDHNFHLVWLDRKIDTVNDDDCGNSITKLRQVVNTINTFTDVDKCIDFITDIKEDSTSMIISGQLSQIIVPVVQEIPQIGSVYILCRNKTHHAKWSKEYSKVKDVCTDIASICEALKQDAQKYDHKSVSISFVKSADDTSKQSLDILDPSFMYT